MLREIHDRLFAFVPTLGADDLRHISYCDEWSVAQVLSHIGSGAEIGRQSIGAVLEGAEPLDQAGREAIWATWNAKSPEEQAADAAVSDESFVTALESTEPERLDNLKLPMGGMEIGATMVLGMWLGERALHAWDVFVTFDPSVRVRPEAVDLLVDSVGNVIPWFAKPAGWAGPAEVAVNTTEPERHFTLRLDERASLAAGSGGATGAQVSLPAEAFVRLVYGRLDAEHSPAEISSEGVDIDQLRKLFPGS